MDVLITTSLAASFLAGVAALFAPCCITVLLPTYLASVFRERRTVFFMTLIFFLGLLTIYLPLGLGFASVGQFLTRYHAWLFGIASAFMIVLGLSILLGFKFSMPMRLPSQSPQPRHTLGSVFVLGIFSGIATSCCAPVLAGALALSMLPGSIFWGGMYAVVFVLGMVVPLFVIAFFSDAVGATKKLSALRRQIIYRIGNRTVRIRIADCISGLTFLAMGGVTLYLAITNPASGGVTGHNTLQTAINITVSQITDWVEAHLSIPAWLMLTGILMTLGVIVVVAVAKERKISKISQTASHERKEVIT